MAIAPSDMLTERDSGAAFVRKANKLLGQGSVDLAATDAARDAAGGHAAQADSAAASAASAAALAAQIRAGQRQGGPIVMPSLLLDWTNNPALDPRIRYTRAGDAWEASPAGVLTRYGANVWPWAGGRSVWPALTNKLTCRKNNPVDTAGWSTSGFTATTFDVVDDMAELRAAGLDRICSSGTVYRLDNRNGTGSASVTCQGVTGNTNPHTASVYWRGQGSGVVSFWGGETVVSLPAAYQRGTRSASTPSGTNAQFYIKAAAGALIYFILPQLIEAAYIGPVIPGDTLTATTRQADNASIPTGPWYNPIGGTWVLDVDREAPSTSDNVILCVGNPAAGFSPDQFYIRRGGTGFITASTTGVSGGPSVSTTGLRSRVAFAHDRQRCQMSVDGGQVRDGAGATSPVNAPSIQLGAAAWGQAVSAHWGGRLRSMVYYPAPLWGATLPILSAQ